MRIAVIGGGISGLVCAYLLRKDHDVVLFETQAELGGHAHSVDLDWQDRKYVVDTGFMVFNDRTYPKFTRLLERLNVPRKPTRMSFSVSCENTGVEYGSHSLGGLFAQRRNLIRRDHYRMLLDILRFNREARALLNAPCGLSLREYLETRNYSAIFVRRYLLPMCAAIWSGSLDSAAEFPADHFVEFFEHHGLLTVADQPQWYVVDGGSRSYVRKIAAAIGSRARTHAPVLAVRRFNDRVEVRSHAKRETFDRVILACHSDQALKLLADPSDAEREVLTGLPYQTNDVVLHHDAGLLPRNHRAWASWNYRVTDDPARPATVTYHMNNLHGLEAPVQFCVTLNQTARIQPGKILKRFEYDHPVYSRASARARSRRAEISGVNRTFYCGAYWENGFHEDGVRSALAVTREFGVTL